MYGNPSGAPSYAGQLAGTLNEVKTPRLSEVQEQVVRGQKLTERMNDRLKSLYDRLQPVLRQTGSGQLAQEAPKPTLVGHANALSNHNDQLDMMDSGLADILDRLEL